MPDLNPRRNILIAFNQLERVIIPPDTASPDDYRSITDAPDGRIILELDTTHLPLGMATGLMTMAEALKKTFTGQDEVSLQKLHVPEQDGLELPDHYKLTLKLPVLRSTYIGLSDVKTMLEHQEASWTARYNRKTTAAHTSARH